MTYASSARVHDRARFGEVLLAPVFILTILPVHPDMFAWTHGSPRTSGEDGAGARQARLK